MRFVIWFETELKGPDRKGSVLVSVGKNDTEWQTRSPDTAGSARNVSDSIGRSGMDSPPRLPHPQTTSSFAQNTIDKDKVCFSAVVSCSQEAAHHQLPMYLSFTTALIVLPDENSDYWSDPFPL